MSSLKYIWGTGNINSGIVFVGEAPGEEEEKQGVPFVGRSGKLLDKWINYLGLNRKDIYITNIVKVRPPDNRTPTDEEIKSWEGVLFQELAVIGNANIIVAVGNSATKALIEQGISGNHGKFHDLPMYNAKVFP